MLFTDERFSLFSHRDEAFPFISFVRKRTIFNLHHRRIRMDVINEQKNNKQSTKVVIITSIDDDHNQQHNPIFSCLNSANFETIMVDLNETNLLETYRTQTKTLVRDFWRVRIEPSGGK